MPGWSTSVVVTEPSLRSALELDVQLHLFVEDSEIRAAQLACRTADAVGWTAVTPPSLAADPEELQEYFKEFRSEHLTRKTGSLESVVGGQRRMVDVPLPGPAQLVSRGPQLCPQVWCIRGNGEVVTDLAEAVRQTSGEQRGAGRGTDAGATEGIGEAHAALGEGVDVGRFDRKTGTRAAQRLDVLLVGQDEQDIRLCLSVHCFGTSSTATMIRPPGAARLIVSARSLTV